MKIFFLILLVICLSTPLSAFAISPPGFGGYVLFAIPCTCPPFGWNIFYGPFYPPPTGAAGFLTFTPGPSVPYAYEQFIAIPTPTSWELGNFTPGAAVCLVGAPPACAPIESEGEIFEVGASFPGFTPAG